MEEKRNFILNAIKNDIASGRVKHNKVITRFPPEPNGYLHIGHAKSICLNYGISNEFENATCNLRFDDTNPSTGRQVYVDAIQNDIRWLGFDWKSHLYFASNYFDQLYEWATKLIKEGLAYVDSQSPEEISSNRGTPTRAGVNSSYRDRPIKENLQLFEEMKNGVHRDGLHVLRAKIDMSHPNLNMRDPVMYRIRHINHQRIGNKWCIYPTYDWAHGQSDAIEGITHSICTLEFENHRPLYEWFLKKLEIEHQPRQLEFAQLSLSYTITSKRKLRQLIDAKHLSSWDDPRMPTLCAMRRRGYTSGAIRKFVNEIRVTKIESLVALPFLEFFVREELNKTSPRVMAVLNPVKLIIDNYPEQKKELLEADNNPEDEHSGTRMLPFSRELFIEREDFLEDPPKNFFRLAPSREVRLKHAYFIRCKYVTKDESGKISEIHCSYDPESRGGKSPDGRKVKGTLHWVSASHALDAEFRLYGTLFTREDINNLKEDENFLDYLNPESLVIQKGKIEPSLAKSQPGDRFQFLRNGYFCTDYDHSRKSPVFNLTVSLKDSWTKQQNRSKS